MHFHNVNPNHSSTKFPDPGAMNFTTLVKTSLLIMTIYIQNVPE